MNDRKTVRPTKKQQELLEFIETFIGEHGYSPSYREIMEGCNYNSVATVALHVQNLIARGHLVKRGRSARSLEVVHSPEMTHSTFVPTGTQEKWLIQAINARFEAYEKNPSPQARDELFVLVGALKVLGLSEAMRSFIPRLPRS